MTVVACLATGCGSEAVKVAGGSDATPTTPREKKAAEAQQKAPKHMKLR